MENEITQMNSSPSFRTFSPFSTLLPLPFKHLTKTSAKETKDQLRRKSRNDRNGFKDYGRDGRKKKNNENEDGKIKDNIKIR